MRHRLIALALCCTTGCGLQNIIDTAKATTIVGGLVVASPALQLAGFFDVASEPRATAWVAKRQSVSSTAEPDAISGAKVTVSSGGGQVQLLEQPGGPAGIYVATSASNSKLSY